MDKKKNILHLEFPSNPLPLSTIQARSDLASEFGMGSGASQLGMAECTSELPVTDFILGYFPELRPQTSLRKKPVYLITAIKLAVTDGAYEQQRVRVCSMAPGSRMGCSTAHAAINACPPKACMYKPSRERLPKAWLARAQRHFFTSWSTRRLFPPAPLPRVQTSARWPHRAQPGSARRLQSIAQYELAMAYRVGPDKRPSDERPSASRVQHKSDQRTVPYQRQPLR